MADGRPSDTSNVSVDYRFKVLLLGDSEVGKTCLLERLTKGEAASMATKATVGVEFGTKTLTVERKLCRIQIWDTAGQERYRSIATNYYRGAQGVLIMYDITRMESMDHVRDWMSSLKQHVTDCAIVMLGNKDDLAEARVVTKATGMAEAAELSLPFFETSAASGHNIEEALLELAKLMKQRVDSGVRHSESGKSTGGIASPKVDIKTVIKSETVSSCPCG